MQYFTKLSPVALAFTFAVTLAQGALAGNVTSSSDYNGGYGMASGQENQAIDPSLRDANGNLTMVNGVFTSSNMGQSNFQQMSSLGAANSGSTLTTGGVGFGSSNIAAAQAVGNSLNVVTVGTGNTVIVNSHQTNNGN
jgi:holdfast attachment protein HfaA